uniref:Uncharacterized protein n=1 Tax=Rhizophora mucronata TaxID=61149 RepID=A0A2P2N5V9_RHIMU
MEEQSCIWSNKILWFMFQSQLGQRALQYINCSYCLFKSKLS